MSQRNVVWAAVEHPGMEYLSLVDDGASVAVTSTILSVEDGGAFHLDYRLHCDDDFTIRSVHLSVAGEKIVVFNSDGQGNWTDEVGNPLPKFAGCVDIDITATPFTNTLPLRRLAWDVGQRREFKMLYVTAPALTLSISEQRYTCLEKSAMGGLFRFELVDGSFSADFPVDADGLVLDYPGLFRRLWTA